MPAGNARDVSRAELSSATSLRRAVVTFSPKGASPLKMVAAAGVNLAPTAIVASCAGDGVPVTESEHDDASAAISTSVPFRMKLRIRGEAGERRHGWRRNAHRFLRM